ncbi:NADP(H)-dependent aldo-keto reductase [Denitrobaculum tricleocarpae]|uniref:Protein tas n=1 Tax=Denitrobaculum tricleocarpae TaxID=2591009 RepID=A0A545TR50_9PROT|nr:NADP(H)-dependent aldo-keto reductase [Denitrobaculum tricleocarpae]TQV79707.1 NADP(H)-dependent aldo-keto reductase [Denitrobaculum tricleocarpae]
MEYRRLGRSDIKVSSICLGTMTWGSQNTEEEAFAQMDYALGEGVNFFDTAEMYPAPPREETFNRTEEIIGNWLASRGSRDKVVIATKVTGPGSRFPFLRDGKPRLTREHIVQAVDDSLKRLQTDYIDLYQLHWPDRSTNFFGKLGFTHDAEEDMTPIEETLDALAEVETAGKIRQIGVSNETPWGVMTFLQMAKLGLGPRVVSIQNPYSLLNRSFEAGLAEIAIREKCGLLAYAPLGAGTLSGKYLDGQSPEGARFTLFPENRRYRGDHADAAVRAYVDLARAHDLEPAQMALAYVNTRPFMTSTIIGSTSLEQLKPDIAASDITLGDEVLDAIEKIHKTYTYPCP